MPLARYKAEWSRQPPAPRVDWSNPLAKDLVFLAPLGPGSFRDIVGQQTLSPTGLSQYESTANGRYPLFGASNYLDVPNNIRTSGTDAITFAWTQDPRNPSAASAVLDWKPASGATYSFAIYLHQSNYLYYFTAGPRFAAAASWSADAGPLTDGRLDKYVLICYAGVAQVPTSATDGFYDLYRNGAPVVRGNNTSYGASTAAVFRIGALGGGSDPFEGLLGNFHIWQRALSAAEAAEWSTNEFDLLQKRPIWVPESAVSTTPVLSAPSYFNLTATTVNPRVTITF